MKTELIIYHGSKNIIETPEYGKGKPYHFIQQLIFCIIILSHYKREAP